MEPTTWVRLVFQYGSFAFAVLFCIVLTRWGYGIYQKACSRKDPPASKQEKNTYRIYFLSTAFFGIILVVVSTVFWIAKYKTWHVYQGLIKDLDAYKQVTSDDLYFQQDWERYFEGSPQIRDEHFMAIQDEPFNEDQEFKVKFSKRGERWDDELPIKYMPGIIPEYSYKFSPEEEKMTLILLNPPPIPKSSGQSASFFVSPAYALELTNLAGNKSSIAERPIVDMYIVELLQNERTDVGEKIAALDKLNKLSNDILWQYLEVSTPKEPMIITLLDLSRHTDEELAYKAGRLINERVEINPSLAERLMSKNREAQEGAEKVLFRIEKWRAEEILSYIPEDIHDQRINSLREEIQDGQKTKVLIPTGSSTGDRYFIRLEWDPENKDVVNCLAELFYKNLRYNEPLEQEYKRMESQSERRIYEESKEGALHIAREIERCGGKASFVRFDRRKK